MDLMSDLLQSPKNNGEKKERKYTNFNFVFVKTGENTLSLRTLV